MALFAAIPLIGGLLGGDKKKEAKTSLERIAETAVSVMMQDITNCSQKTSAEQDMNIGNLVVSGKGSIADISQKMKAVVNLTCINKSEMDNKLVNSIMDKLSAEAKQVGTDLDGLFGAGQSTNTTTTLRSSLKANVNMSKIANNAQQNILKQKMKIGNISVTDGGQLNLSQDMTVEAIMTSMSDTIMKNGTLQQLAAQIDSKTEQETKSTAVGLVDSIGNSINEAINSGVFIMIAIIIAVVVFGGIGAIIFIKMMPSMTGMLQALNEPAGNKSQQYNYPQQMNYQQSDNQQTIQQNQSVVPTILSTTPVTAPSSLPSMYSTQSIQSSMYPTQSTQSPMYPTPSTQSSMYPTQSTQSPMYPTQSMQSPMYPTQSMQSPMYPTQSMQSPNNVYTGYGSEEQLHENNQEQLDNLSDNIIITGGVKLDPNSPVIQIIDNDLLWYLGVLAAVQGNVDAADKILKMKEIIAPIIKDQLLNFDTDITSDKQLQQSKDTLINTLKGETKNKVNNVLKTQSNMNENELKMVLNLYDIMIDILKYALDNPNIKADGVLIYILTNPALKNAILESVEPQYKDAANIAISLASKGGVVAVTSAYKLIGLVKLQIAKRKERKEEEAKELAKKEQKKLESSQIEQQIMLEKLKLENAKMEQMKLEQMKLEQNKLVQETSA